MSGPIDRFGLGSMRQGSASSKQEKSTLTTNPNRWKLPEMRISMSSSPISLLVIQLPMYAVLFLAGFGAITKFQLDTTVLTTLAGIAAASMFPYSISMAVRAIRKSGM